MPGAGQAKVGAGPKLELPRRSALVGTNVRMSPASFGISNRGEDGGTPFADVVVRCPMLMRLAEVARAEAGRANGDRPRVECKG